MTHRLQPAFEPDRLLAVYDYPASQCALARIRADDPPVAERFEVYLGPLELANGYHELGDAGEQRARFERDLDVRRERNAAATAVGRTSAGGVAGRLAGLRRRGAGRRSPADGDDGQRPDRGRAGISVRPGLNVAQHGGPARRNLDLLLMPWGYSPPCIQEEDCHAPHFRFEAVVRGRHARDQLLASVAIAAPQYAAPYGNDPGYRDGQVVRCESSDGRSRECPIDSYGRVQLVRQLSGAPCIEGRTWGSR